MTTKKPSTEVKALRYEAVQEMSGWNVWDSVAKQYIAGYGENSGRARSRAARLNGIAPREVKVGDRIRTTEELEFFPHFNLPAGAEGTVVSFDAKSVQVKMTEPIKGCEEWNNEIGFDRLGFSSAWETYIFDESTEAI